MISVRIWRSEEVFWRPGSLLREVWGVWGTILAPIGWVGRGNGSGAGNWRANGASNGALQAGRWDLTLHQLSEPGPRGGVGEGIILMYMRIVHHSTRPEAQGLGGL